MDEDFYRRKLAVRFATLDYDGDGRVEGEDVLQMTRRLCAAFGEAEGSPKYRAVLAAAERYWREISHVSDSAGALTVAEYTDAMWEHVARRPAAFDRIARPWVETLFDVVDRNDNGYIEIEEFVGYFRALGARKRAAGEAFELLDRSRDGRLTKDELVAAAREYYVSASPDDLGNWLFGQF